MKNVTPILLGLFLTACSLEQRVLNVSTKGGDDVARRNALLPPVGLQNFRQAIAAREAALGSQLNLASPVYAKIAGLLSPSGDSETTQSPLLVAMGTLSSELCTQLVDRERVLPSAQRSYFKNVLFSTTTVSLDDNKSHEVAQDLFRIALQRPPSTGEEAAVADAVREAATGANPANAVPDRVGVVVGCSAVFASPDAITN